jgi:hypothetical protein
MGVLKAGIAFANHLAACFSHDSDSAPGDDVMKVRLYQTGLFHPQVLLFATYIHAFWRGMVLTHIDRSQ